MSHTVMAACLGMTGFQLAAPDDWTRVGAEFQRLRRPRIAHVQATTGKMSRIAGPARSAHP